MKNLLGFIKLKTLLKRGTAPNPLESQNPRTDALLESLSYEYPTAHTPHTNAPTLSAYSAFIESLDKEGLKHYRELLTRYDTGHAKRYITEQESSIAKNDLALQHLRSLYAASVK